MEPQDHCLFIKELLSFIDHSPTAFHVADNLRKKLDKNSFSPFIPKEPLQTGDRRYAISGSSALFTFVIGQDPLHGPIRLIGAHSDAPSLVIKPRGLFFSEGCILLNTEVYGSPILSTWFDRPLSLAGRVVLETDDPFTPEIRLVCLDVPRLIIPNAAIHMNRSVNEGQKIEPQKMMLPILGLAGSKATDKLLEQILASDLSVDPEKISDYDLFLYDQTPSTFLGLEDAFISAPRLDNLGLAYAAVTALVDTPPQSGINLVACFDHEEVGSQTRQGAQSLFLRDLLEQIILALGGSRSDFLNCFDRAFLISADQAHAVHPNFSEFADATNRPRINGGPVIKRSANRSYTSDADSCAVFKALCQKAGVPCQYFANRSDMRGGSTIGPIFTANLPVRSVDVGNPIWAMHSIRETGGVYDHAAMLAVFKTYFSSESASGMG